MSKKLQELWQNLTRKFTVCGYVVDGKLPENCSVCRPPKTKIQRID
jgi:rubrerythrin